MHVDCWLLTTEHDKCDNCHHFQRSLKDQARRSLEETSKDPSKRNDRYLSTEEKDAKLEKIEKEKESIQKKYR